MPIQALILLAILAASAIFFTVVFVIVADRELAKPEGREANEAREEREVSDAEGEENAGRMEREEGSGGGHGG